MTAKPKAASRILDAVRETATGLHEAGLIDMRRMQKYEELCLTPVPARSKSGRAGRYKYKGEASWISPSCSNTPWPA